MYRELNDYEIIYMVRDDDDSFRILYEKYQPLIYKITKNYFNTFKKYGYEEEDLMQLGCIALYKASNLYNAYNESVFYSYLKRAIINTIIMEFRKNNTSKRLVLNKAFSYDEIVPNTNFSYLELFPDKSIINEDDYYRFVSFKNLLDYDLACIFELYYNGYPIKEISLLLDRKIELVKESIKEIRREALTYNYLFFN